MLRQEDYNTSKASSQKSTCLRNSKINVFRNNPVLAIIWCNLLIMTLFLCISRTITTAGETFVHQIHHEWFNYSIQPYQRTTCCPFPPTQRDAKPAFVLSLHTASGKHPSAIVTWRSMDELRWHVWGLSRRFDLRTAADIRSSAEKSVLMTPDSDPVVFTHKTLIRSRLLV